MRRFWLCAVGVVCLGFATVSVAHAVEIQEVTGPKSGVKAWLVEDHKFPVVALHFAFDGGGEQDPADKQGLAALTTRALTAGAGPYDAQAFQQQLADSSIGLDVGAGRDALAGGLKCLGADKKKAFELLRLALTQPRFEPADIERLRAEQMTAVKRQLANPEWQGRYALFSHLFAGHPYGQRLFGSTRTLAALTREDVKDFAARHLARDTLTVALAGDLTAEEAAQALDSVFADLPAHARLEPVPDVQGPAEAPVILLRREGTQTDMLFAMPGMKRDDPDYYAAEIANYVLGGGGFASRLMQEMRDKKGLTYGVGTDVAPSRHAGMIWGHLAVDNPKAADAVALLRETLRRFHDEGVAPRELAAAQDYLTGAQPLALTSTDKIAGVLVSMQRDNLGIDYLDRYAPIIRGVSAGDVARVVERWFVPEKMTLVLVGKPEGVAPTRTKELEKQ